jgi:hypothetical protein
MASSRFRVTDASAPRRAVAPDIHDRAEHIAADAAARTPRASGLMASSWQVVPGNDPATSLVTNPVPYARFVEYGTRYQAAAAPLGQALARARGSG